MAAPNAGADPVPVAAPPRAPTKPPEPVPDALQGDIGKLHRNLATLLAAKQIHWVIQARLANDGYVTVEDLADRWDSPEQAREEGPRDLGFEPTNQGWDEASSRFAATRPPQAARAARQALTYGPPGMAPTGAQPMSSKALWMHFVTGDSWRIPT